VSRRALVLLWIVVAVLVWNVVFDLYVSRGAREYLQMAAEAELGRGPEPAMRDVMDGTNRRGATAATFWALVVFGAGCVTIYFRRRDNGPPRPGRPSGQDVTAS
jgi:hypothetical protein